MPPEPNGTLAYRVQRLEEEVEKLRTSFSRILLALVLTMLTFVVSIAVYYLTEY